ncbi:MAG: SPOR domain-containing protein [Desulfovibrio desulfuricans]|uniref:SPOR domain-containing protein n=1 Tax=Desulfovibrio sp. WGS1351 TaxID=3366814 RepID=UPI0025CF85AF|nr:SPOR domain-containing protein [uncultured Desulfovibrio sp.]MDY0202668.1 SPOR domain-containing protein [Desulfovibrio desulfuricans]
MPSVFRSKSPSGQEEPSKCLCLRPSSLLAACFLVVAAIALAYVGGVMSGRAYWRSHGTQQTAMNRTQGGPAESEPQAEDVPQQHILAPEELKFARVLRGESLPPGMAEGLKPGEVAAAPAHGQQAGPKTVQNVVPATPPPTGQAVQAAQADQPVVLNSLQPISNTFDYVFQVGAFKDEESVDSLRQRLEGRGLRTRMQRSGKLLVVFVMLRGNDARAEEVVQTCESLSLGKPILRSKTAVTH